MCHVHGVCLNTYYSIGLNVLFSGAADEFSVSQEVYNTLIPPMVEVLASAQKSYPYPPDPKVYEGVYTLGIAGYPNFTIATYENQLLMKGLYSVFLAYSEPLFLQVKNESMNSIAIL